MSTDNQAAGLRRARGRIAVIGGREVVIPFKALGLDAFPVETGPNVRSRVETLLHDGYQVIFFTEELFPELEPVVDEHRSKPTPCLVALPSAGLQHGIFRLKRVVKRAVGADVLNTG